ncbi:MAG: hypothetical protein HQL31_11560, partial [Planctomycetes bacterium]|nr:hypothetical protein [Planctomycetota bacterium]
RLFVSGSLALDGGILANGTDTGATWAGAGSGGSVWVSANSISGNGSVRADGGNQAGSYGGGSGGRVAMYLTGAGANFESLGDNITAYGGSSGGASMKGAAGTVYLETADQAGAGNLLIDNSNRDVYDCTDTPVLNGGDLTLTDLIIRNKGILTGNGITCENLSITGGSSLRHFRNVSTEAYKLSITATGSASIDATSTIDVSYRGYAGGCGPGAGFDSETGGSYGGFGGRNFGSSITYGSWTAPGNLGSGGQGASGGAGGGWVTLSVNGALSLDGDILARGQNNGFWPGGSGGSVYIRAESMSGGGDISADGGNASQRGGGGGGRIAVIITTSGNDLSGYTGSMSAYGGVGVGSTFKDAAAGTIYTLVPSQSGAGNLMIDNDIAVAKSLVAGAYTPILDGSNPVITDLSIRNDGDMRVSAAQTFTCSGNWTNTSNMAIALSLVNFNATAAKVITSNSDSFNNLSFDGLGGSWTLQDALSATGNLSLANGILDANDFGLAINGSIAISGGNLHSGTGALAFGDAGADSVVVSGGNVVIESDDPDSDIALNAGTWTNTGGTIWYMGGSSTTIFSSLSPYRGLIVNAPGATLTASADIDVNGSFALSAGTISLGSHTLYISGDVSVSGGTVVATSGNVVFDGDLTYTDSSGSVVLPDLFIGNSPDTTTLGSNMMVGNLTINAGDRFIAAGYDLTVLGNLVCYGNFDASAGSSEISVGGDWVMGNIFLAGGSNVVIGGAVPQLVSSGSAAGNTFNTLSVSNIVADVNFAGAWSAGNFSCVSPGANLVFEAGGHYTVSSSLVLKGIMAKPIFLNSSDDATRFTLDLSGGTQDCYGLTVANSEAASNDISPFDSVDAANNDSGEGSPMWILSFDNGITWENDSANGLWSTAANWSGDALPNAGNTV